MFSARSARALSIPYLFFAGLSEKAFRLRMQKIRLYGEADYQLLAQHDLPFVLRAERPGRNAAVLRGAHAGYPAIVSQLSRPRRQSPGHAPQSVPGRSRAHPEHVPAAREMPDLSPLPAGDVPHGAGERRLLAVSQSLEGRGGLLAGLCQDSQTQPLADNITAALKTVRAQPQRRIRPLGRHLAWVRGADVAGRPLRSDTPLEPKRSGEVRLLSVPVPGSEGFAAGAVAGFGIGDRFHGPRQPACTPPWPACTGRSSNLNRVRARRPLRRSRIPAVGR